MQVNVNNPAFAYAGLEEDGDCDGFFEETKVVLCRPHSCHHNSPGCLFMLSMFTTITLVLISRQKHEIPYKYTVHNQGHAFEYKVYENEI